MVEYTANTDEATATVTATPLDEDAEIEILNGDTPVENEGTATWADGENELTVHVHKGAVEKTYTVVVTYTAPSANLSGLTIGSLTLTPTFDGDVTEYTTTTTNATNKITATPEDEDATIEILNGETPVENEEAATWVEGENTVTITVTNGSVEKTYTVVVTKTTEQ